MIDPTDYEFMARALVLAERGLYTTDPNPRVGCVLVRDGRVVGEGWHQYAGEDHAEVRALAAAGTAAQGATAYVTLEPCCHHGRTPPCTDALLAAGVTRVVAAMEDPNPRVAGNGLAQLRAAGLAVDCGVLEAEAQALNPGFRLRMVESRPFVRCKLAMSLDGRTALASGESRWITADAARQDVQRLRARASAIMTGVGTVLADDPGLDVRLPAATGRQPLRVILDSELTTPPAARTLHIDGQVLIFTTTTAPERQAPLLQAGAEIAVLPPRNGRVDLRRVLAELARRGCNEVHLECGATLAGAMLAASLLDELIIYVAPLLLGDSARGLFHLPGVDRMSERITLDISDVRPVGRDWRITARPVATGTSAFFRG
jgi:diaminohydroxyphosphoribosylaminopyrimidine deaminase/5-amino-6-(5-phosphoribosylamino)uracil reductase